MEYEIKPAGKFSLGLHELWEFRELFYFFTWRDIKIKYKQAILGIFWAILQPLFLMILFSLFFGQALKVPSDNIPYPVFVFSGLLLWNVFSSGLTNAANSMVANSNIIKKIYFPRLIIPMSSILVALFDFIMSLFIYIGLLIYYHYSIDWTFIVFLPASVIMVVLTTFGLGTFIAAVNIKYRDFRYILPFLVQILLFLTPVIYPVSIIRQGWIQNIMLLNPIAGAIDLLRACVIHSSPDWSLIGVNFLVSVCLFASGVIYFRKTEYYFADLA